jgi:hypothetical protein
VLGTPEETAANAEPLDGPALSWSRAVGRELGIDFVAGSIEERGDAGATRPCTSVPDGAEWPSTSGCPGPDTTANARPPGAIGARKCGSHVPNRS